jgi:hypothetical protein
MKVPNLSIGQFTDKEGHLTPEAKNFFALLIQNMQADLSDEGIVAPSQSTATITSLASSTNGAILYDSSTDELKVNIGGVMKVVQVV